MLINITDSNIITAVVVIVVDNITVSEVVRDPIVVSVVDSVVVVVVDSIVGLLNWLFGIVITVVLKYLLDILVVYVDVEELLVLHPLYLVQVLLIPHPIFIVQVLSVPHLQVQSGVSILHDTSHVSQRSVQLSVQYMEPP